MTNHTLGFIMTLSFIITAGMIGSFFLGLAIGYLKWSNVRFGK